MSILSLLLSLSLLQLLMPFLLLVVDFAVVPFFCCCCCRCCFCVQLQTAAEKIILKILYLVARSF